MRQTAASLLVVFAVLMIMFSFSDEAYGIAAWARKYDVSCTACHSMGYRLNRDGIAFLRRGHFYAKDEATKSLGDYLAYNTKIRFNDGNDADTLDNKVGDVTFEYHAFALYSGGMLAPRFSFFTEIYLHEREGTPSKVDTFGDGGRTKLAEAFLQYTRGDENYFTIRAGQIASQLWYLQGAGGRLAETRNFLVNNTTITTNAGLKNNWLPRQRDYGVELGAHRGDLHWVLGLTNGNGNSPTNVVENKGQGAKDFYTSADYTLQNKAQIGLFYHKGKLEDPTLLTKNKDDFHRLGFTFNANPSDRMWILGSYIRGEDEDDIPLLGARSKVKSSGYAFEFDYLLNEAHGIAPFARYDHFTHDGKSTLLAETNTNTNAFVLGCTFNLFDEQRGRIVVEWQYLKQEEEGPTATKALTKDQNLRVELSFML